ncbi:MAG: YicC family protein [Myxococcaceae bacterium]|nr:YicC family protein [Myxococcaceae bacterium]
MTRSMTGFGVATATVGEEQLTVEARSVNHKFCEVKVRLPRELSALEVTAIKHVKDTLSRGAVDLTVKRTSAAGNVQTPMVDLTLAKAYQKVFSDLANTLGLSNGLNVRDIVQQVGVMQLQEHKVNIDDAQKALAMVLEAALRALVQMREIEGKSLAADLTERLEEIAKTVGELQRLAPQVVDDYRARLSDRVKELSAGIPVEPQRLAHEVALFAERTDIAEELTRLKSHLEQFRALLADKEPAGRRMDFLVQEMNREINTTGSKSQHADISSRVVALKAELERVREQVQNIE